MAYWTVEVIRITVATTYLAFAIVPTFSWFVFLKSFGDRYHFYFPNQLVFGGSISIGMLRVSPLISIWRKTSR